MWKGAAAVPEISGWEAFLRVTVMKAGGRKASGFRVGGGVSSSAANAKGARCVDPGLPYGPTNAF